MYVQIDIKMNRWMCNPVNSVRYITRFVPVTLICWYTYETLQIITVLSSICIEYSVVFISVNAKATNRKLHCDGAHFYFANCIAVYETALLRPK